MTVGTVPSGLGDRARTLAGSLPAGAATAVRRLVFCAWLAAMVGGAVVLGGSDAGWVARTVDNLVLLAVAGLGAFFFAALAAIPVHLLLALVRLGWRSMPEAVFQFPAPILGVVFAALYLGGSVEPLPIDVHPVVYGLLVVGWAAGSFFGLLPTFEVMSWFDRPRPAPTQMPAPVAVPRPPSYPWTGPEPAEVFWSPTTVTAWRGWTWHDGALRGMWQPWPASTLTARCPHGCERAPTWSCTCGIYATTDRPTAGFGDMVGVVELTGRVIEHDRGYRAEHARIRTLYAPPPLCHDLACAYPDVEVIPT
jgi:hypothetical protein